MSGDGSVSIREFARRIGVSHTAVQKAIKAGDLSTLPSGRLDPERALAQWSANRPMTAIKQHASPPGRSRPPAPPAVDPEADPSPQKGKRSAEAYSAARAVHEAHKARLAELTLKRKQGELVDAAAVRRRAFDYARTIRERLQAIPERVAGQVAALTDAHEVAELLSAEIATALGEVADELGAVVEEATRA